MEAITELKTYTFQEIMDRMDEAELKKIEEFRTKHNIIDMHIPD